MNLPPKLSISIRSILGRCVFKSVSVNEVEFCAAAAAKDFTPVPAAGYNSLITESKSSGFKNLYCLEKSSLFPIEERRLKAGFTAL